MAPRDRAPSSERRSPWREPASLIPLRWGWYRERLALGTALIVSGGIAIAGSNTWSLWLLGLGTTAYLVGWSILPSAGWRRVVVLFPATLAAWLLLTGPRFIGVLVVPYLAWLLVRHRPPRSYATVLFVIATSVMIVRIVTSRSVFTEYEYMTVALGSGLAVMALSAWAARALHAAGAARPLPARVRAERGTAPPAAKSQHRERETS